MWRDAPPSEWREVKFLWSSSQLPSEIPNMNNRGRRVTMRNYVDNNISNALCIHGCPVHIKYATDSNKEVVKGIQSILLSDPIETQIFAVPGILPDNRGKHTRLPKG
jgi:hypothetical protein